MTRASVYRRSRSSNPAVAIPALVRLGALQEVGPSVDTGFRLYGPGRLMLPAATCLCVDPQGTAATFWGTDTAHTTVTPNQALPLPIPGVPLITKCLKLVNDGTADAPVTANITVSASTSYNSSLYVFVPEFGGNLTITAENGHSFSLAAVTALSSGWTRYAVQSNTVAGEVVLGLKFSFAGGTQSTAYVTGFNPIATTVVTPYFDGGFADCAWTGAANGSTSTRAASGLKHPAPDGLATAGTIAMRFVPLGTDPTVQGNVIDLLNVSNGIVVNAWGWAPDTWYIDTYGPEAGSGSIHAHKTAVVGTPKTWVGSWTQGTTGTLDLTVDGTVAAQATQTQTLAAITYVATSGGSTNALYRGPIAVCPANVGATNRAALDAMLTAGATGLDLARWFSRNGYMNTLILPLDGDSRGYVVKG